jgi:hypothetical protein
MWKETQKSIVPGETFSTELESVSSRSLLPGFFVAGPALFTEVLCRVCTTTFRNYVGVLPR